MADRLEYQGNPLPPGLPGIGGSTVTSLNFPQQGAYFPPIVNGPVVDIPVNSTAQPPSPTAPVGNDPATPTDQVVTPGFAPTQGGGFSITDKLNKTGNPCDVLRGFINNLASCNYFVPYTVCVDGAPKEVYLLTYPEHS
jgi:hypothetical protein